MRKVAALMSVVLACGVPGAALAEAQELVVVGVPDGRLAAAPLMARDYAKAAHRLAEARPDGANDPARLINLGNAYAGLGRLADAREAYRSARFAPDSLLRLADGEETSSRGVARLALSRLEANYAMR